jgi:transcriptional regulator with XRE-family HTH domain
MGFTENFNYCMEQRNYSAYRFAKILGVNIQSPVNWKTGASIPHYGTRQKIAEHFGITLAELDGDELPVLPPEGAKKAPDPEIEGVMEDEDLKEAVELLKKMDKETLRIFIKAARGALEN